MFVEKKDTLIIVPDETVLDVFSFERNLKKGERHLKYIEEFCQLYQIPYALSKSEDNFAPIYLSQMGHLVVKTSYDFMKIVIFYIPEKLTFKQQEWLEQQLLKYYSFQYTGFSYFDGEKTILKESFSDGLKLIRNASLKYQQTQNKTLKN